MGLLWQSNKAKEIIAWADDREMKEEQGIGEKGRGARDKG
jgi:hypothetical protein